MQAKDSAGQAEAAAEGAAVARQFAEQQEQLVCARERGMALEQRLRQRDLLIEQQAQELASLRDQLASAGRPCSVDGPTRQAGGAALRSGVGGLTAAHMQQLGRTSSDGSEGGESWLRLKYLKAKSALDSVVASNTRLLRKLEAAHAQLRDLRAQQAQQQGRGGELRTAAAPQSVGISMDEISDSRIAGANTSAAPGSLRQQLAAANHRAARLQIELDAAVAKLAIYQAHSSRGQQPSRQLSKQASQPSWQPSRQASQRQDAAAQRAERVASWLGGAPARCPSGGGEAIGMPAGGSAAGTMEHKVPQQTPQLGAEACSDSSGEQ